MVFKFTITVCHTDFICKDGNTAHLIMFWDNSWQAFGWPFAMADTIPYYLFPALNIF